MAGTPEPAVRRTGGKKGHDVVLASEQSLRRFAQRKSFFTMELQRQQANRYQMALDESYYDGDQWTPEEAAEVRSRGQNPVVYNEVAPTVDFMIGTERRTRTDYEIMARNDDSPEAEQDAEAKSKYLKYLDDINKTTFERSSAVDDQLKAGLGWLEVCVIGDSSQAPIRSRSESWRYMLHDSLGSRSMVTTQDMRYIFRFKEVDFDIADAMFGYKKTDLLRKAVVHYDMRQVMDWMNGSPMTGMLPSFDDGLPRKWNTFDADAWVNNPRERLLLIEAWATEPRGGSERSGTVGEDDPIRMDKRVALMTEYDTLLETWSPYRHGRYPFIPYWCYRRKRDGQPYGVVRRLRGPQDMINKHMSKAQFRLSVNQIRMEDGALSDDMDEQELADEAASPDGILKFAAGALQNKRVEFLNGLDLVEADVKLMAENRATVRSASGVSGEDRGTDHYSPSGKAREKREEESGKLTAAVFDQIRLARIQEGEITLSLTEQYVREPVTFSVPGEIKKREWVKLNQPGPNGEVLNDITAREAQFVIGEQPWNVALSEASFEAAMDMLGSLSKTAPQVVISILDIVFELNPHLPKKARILQRIRQATGMPDPDKGPTPEQVQQNQKKEQMADAQFQAQLALLQAKVAEAKGKGQKLTADAFMAWVGGLYEAAQAAQIIAIAPQLAPIVDELSKSAGFIDQDGPPLIPPQTAPIAAPPVPQLQAPAPLQGHMQGIHTPQPDGIRPGVGP